MFFSRLAVSIRLLQTYFQETSPQPKSPHTFIYPFTSPTLLHRSQTIPVPQSPKVSSKTMRTASKAKKQSLLMRFISLPFRTFAKARNFYMRGMADCAGKVGGGGGVGGYALSQVRSSGSNDDDDVRQLIRTASSKKNNTGKENKNDNIRAAAGSDVNRNVRPIDSVRQAANTTNNGRGVRTLRSYSVGLKMGRIDEERVSTFEEDEINVKADLYTRTRSYAVNKRNAGFV